MKRTRLLLLFVLLGALAVAPSAVAKFRITLSVSDGTPAVGQLVQVTVKSAVDLKDDENLRLVAVGRSV